MNKCGEMIAAEAIHVPRMKNGQSLDLMSGQRSGNATATNRFTVIKTRFCIETIMQMSAKKLTNLHKAWPNWPPMSHKFVRCINDRSVGGQNIEYSRSDMAIFAMK